MRFLRPLESAGVLRTWADTQLDGGATWERELQAAMETATVAVLLVSQDFLDSRFIGEVELPALLAREAAGELSTHEREGEQANDRSRGPAWVVTESGIDYHFDSC
jgi:hypothetical protein